MALFSSQPPSAPQRRLWRLPITPNMVWQRRSGPKTSILRSRSPLNSWPVWSGSIRPTCLTPRPGLAARAKVALAVKAAGKGCEPIASQPKPYPNRPALRLSPGRAPLQMILIEPRNSLLAANRPGQMGATAKQFSAPKASCSATHPSPIARIFATRYRHKWHAAGAKQPLTCGHRFFIISLKISRTKALGLQSAWTP